ncbi:hypothetical protein M409DRAFT_70632 [Zasmidium cellare ATCC 36951]|uniref:Zn(2)-C6 fungal-type domain-containing protein n=1 Tax=Zasmidium cellare ATCC 36951 TaxID=1080233 RepID=A0A6A6BZ66_ZASCE|nr:uncharacterized protein M409DRAFT_70632 [Zasmidium cellare ATCC 36951]KAF2160094.1 hypothetical protein M409DRAFT_70632 [Zasmidium cellare ATCC 36951]
MSPRSGRLYQFDCCAGPPGRAAGAGLRSRLLLVHPMHDKWLTALDSKSKCDEERPQCGNCLRRGAPCEYREAFSEKLERSTTSITDSLRRIENKLDTWNMSNQWRFNNEVGHPSPTSRDWERTGATSSSQSLGNGGSQTLHSGNVENEISPTRLWSPAPEDTVLTVPHQILLWPVFYQVLTQANPEAATGLSRIRQQGSFWFISHEISTRKSVQPPGSHIESDPVCPVWPTLERIQVTDLTLDWIMSRSEAYFNTFNILFPILNRSHFTNHVCHSVLRDGFIEGESNTVIALHVFALGEVAILTSMNDNWTPAAQRNEGERQKGPKIRAPGLTLFNEARRQQSMMHSHNLLEKVQALLLQGMYYDSASCYLDLWQSLTAASIACQTLVKSHEGDWSGSRGDYVKRAYWTCVLTEDMFHVDLDLPPTGITAMQDEVPFPHFQELRDAETTYNPRQKDRSEAACLQFLAMLTLRRIITRIHRTLHSTTDQSATAIDDTKANVLAELVSQLDSWQSALPARLQWLERPDGPSPAPSYTQRESTRAQIHTDETTDYQKAPDTRTPQYATTRQDYINAPIAYEHIDVVVIRIRYYYARLIAELPLLYKCLHTAEDIPHNDKIRCGQAIRYACDWPLVMSPLLRDHKRLVPQNFACTHNFIWITVLLHLVTRNKRLRDICQADQMLDRVAKSQQQTLFWLHDLSGTDCVAHWAWHTLQLGELASSP